MDLLGYLKLLFSEANEVREDFIHSGRRILVIRNPCLHHRFEFEEGSGDTGGSVLILQGFPKARSVHFTGYLTADGVMETETDVA